MIVRYHQVIFQVLLFEHGFPISVKEKKLNLADNNIVKQSNKQLVRFSNNSRRQLLLHYNNYSIIYKRKM